jgi:hypothetical protein
MVTLRPASRTPPGDFTVNPSLLPPRGIFVPTNMIFHTQIPSAVLVTWLQLRCLAWRGWNTPPLSLSEFASLIGIHPARLQKHLAQLQDVSALVCRTTKDGKLIVSFPGERTTRSENPVTEAILPDVPIRTPQERESIAPASYFPTRILGYVSYQDDQEELEITHDLKALNIELENAAKCY